MRGVDRSGGRPGRNTAYLCKVGQNAHCVPPGGVL
jgi:hypothetical protein